MSSDVFIFKFSQCESRQKHAHIQIDISLCINDSTSLCSVRCKMSDVAFSPCRGSVLK